MISDRPHYVYRALDAHGLLLYVGCSNDVARRLTQHRANGLWTQYLAEVTSSGPLSRDEALRVEAKAIATEQPFFNAQPEHTAMVQANRNAARKLLDTLPVEVDSEDDASCCAFYDAVAAIGLLIRHKYPVVNDAVRTEWYLAERARVAGETHHLSTA